jgi:hypothetical protein
MRRAVLYFLHNTFVLNESLRERMTNREFAEIFDRIADMLEIQGETF